MSHRSKRERAPADPPAPAAPQASATPQALAAAGVPWWGAATKLNSSPTSSVSMASSPGWWAAPHPQNNSFVPPYGPWMGVVPTPNGHGNLDTSTNSLQCPPDGFQSLLQNGLKGKTVINIDDGEEVRKEKRLSWLPEEDTRLVSAWLFHSNDPISGNGKKNDQYWLDLHAQYHLTTPPNRKRQVKHLRDRFQKIKKCVGFFCGSWKKATSIRTSGQSDDQVREMALQFYLDDHKEGPFNLMHCWKIMKDEPKWLAIFDDLENSNKRKITEEGEEGNRPKPEDTREPQRPIGTKEAKKQRLGKGSFKAKETGLDEDMKKYMDIQAAASKRHEEFLETQQRVSNAKVEAARLRREATLLESYKDLMNMDTSGMDEDMKAEHKLGLKILREKLTGQTN